MTDLEVYDPELGRRRCTATAKSSGERCKRRPIKGGAVCKIHGGGSPQAVRSARQRLLAAVEPAFDVLIIPLEQARQAALREIESVGFVTPDTMDRLSQLRANAEAIADRTGYPRRAELSMADGVAELEALLDELEA